MTPEIVTKIETLTPERAIEILEKNPINRPISWKNVRDYSSAIKRGEWTLSHQGMAFDSEGRLLDGQHRCLAVKDCGIPIKVMMTTGIPAETIKVIDRQKSRTPGDSLIILTNIGLFDSTGLVGEPKKIAETANMILATLDNTGKKKTPDEILRAIDKFRDGIICAMSNFAGKKGVSTSPVRAGIAFAHKTNPTAVDEFARLLNSGAGLEERSAVLILRNHIMEGVNYGGSGRRTLMIKTLNAISFFMADFPVRGIQATEDALAYFGLAHGLQIQGSTANGLATFLRRHGHGGRGQ